MKIDYLLAIIAGFFMGLFVLPILENTNLKIGYIFLLSIIGFPLLWLAVLLAGWFLQRWFSWIYQFTKFCIVAFLNTAIDFGVLNLFSMLTGLTSGFIIGSVNVPGFILAGTNSYFWNKFWVFRKKTKGDYSDFVTFLLVIIIGIFVNSGIVIFISTYVSPFYGLSPERWLNVAKAVASVTCFSWKFFIFKFFVFKN